MTIPVFRNHFQIAYVVRNVEAAVATMKARFGIENWQIRHLPDSAPAKALGFAWVQEQLLELIEARPEQDDVYRKWIPASDADLRLHHFGYLAESEAHWQALIDQFMAAGFGTALKGSVGDLLDYYYADTVGTLGHYCEVVYLRPAGRNFWGNVPRN